MKYTGTSTRASCHVYCIQHEDFSCYTYVFYITTTPYLPCNKNDITRKGLYDFYYVLVTLTTGYNYYLYDPAHTHSELDDLPMGSFEVNISRLDNAFTQDLVRLLDKLYEFRGQTVGGMVSRLDFNGFYQGRMTSRDITHDII